VHVGLEIEEMYEFWNNAVRLSPFILNLRVTDRPLSAIMKFWKMIDSVLGGDACCPMPHA
jgi:hypothetical protein